MKNVILYSSIFIFSVSCTLTTTAPEQQGPKQAIGTVTGMVIGAKMANDFAEGSRNEGLGQCLVSLLVHLWEMKLEPRLISRICYFAERATMKALEYIINPNRLVIGKIQTVETLALYTQQKRIIEEVSHV